MHSNLNAIDHTVMEPHAVFVDYSVMETDAVSVIVCAYTEERWDDLRAAMGSLREQTVAPHEIILVVDHNPALYVRACTSFPEVQVIENRDSRGLSGARNSGLAVATGTVVAFMDEDAVAAPDWLAQLCIHYVDPAVYGVGGAIKPMWPEERPAWFPAEFDWVVGCTYRGMPQTTAPVRNLIGCNMSFRRDLFDDVGGFRHGIGRLGSHPLGCEETELCIRVKQRWPQSVILFEPQAAVYHRVSPNRTFWRYFRRRCYAEGLSKSLVATFVGAQDGLSNEREYTLRTLPLATWQCVTEVVQQRNLWPLTRAGAIVCGLGFTVAGYLAGTITKRFSLT